MANWHFAYGANMCTRVFIQRRGIDPLSAESARLAGYRLVFKQAGIPLIEPCFASLESDPDQNVYGVLYKLSGEAAERLDHFERVGYAPMTLLVEGTKSGWVQATTYNARHPRNGLRPSRRYLNLLIAGAREFELPETHIAFLNSVSCTQIPVVSHYLPPLIEFVERTAQKNARIRALLQKTLKAIVSVSKFSGKR